MDNDIYYNINLRSVSPNVRSVSPNGRSVSLNRDLKYFDKYTNWTFASSEVMEDLGATDKGQLLTKKAGFDLKSAF